MKKIHVSVVVPAHNEEKYVKRCIDSIKELASHFKGNVETIIVCNRCTDKTEEIAKDTFDAIGGFVDKKAMEDVATAKVLKNYGRTKGKSIPH